VIDLADRQIHGPTLEWRSTGLEFNTSIWNQGFVQMGNLEIRLGTDQRLELDRLLTRVDQLTILKTRARYTLRLGRCDPTWFHGRLCSPVFCKSFRNSCKFVRPWRAWAAFHRPYGQAKWQYSLPFSRNVFCP
jgi:hypothetical protein